MYAQPANPERSTPSTPEWDLAQGTREETGYFFERLGNELDGCRREMYAHDQAVDAHTEAIKSLQVRERALLLALDTLNDPQPGAGYSGEPQCSTPPKPEQTSAPSPPPAPMPRSSVTQAPSF